MYRDYFIALYDYTTDVNIANFDDIKTFSQVFNIPAKEVYRKIRNNSCIVHNNRKLRIFLYKKENIESYDLRIR